MTVSTDHVTGFVVGLGVASLGLYLYKKNEAQIDEWLRGQSIKFPFTGCQAKDPSASRWKNCCARRSGWKT